MAGPGGRIDLFSSSREPNWENISPMTQGQYSLMREEQNSVLSLLAQRPSDATLVLGCQDGQRAPPHFSKLLPKEASIRKTKQLRGTLGSEISGCFLSLLQGSSISLQEGRVKKSRSYFPVRDF